MKLRMKIAAKIENVKELRIFRVLNYYEIERICSNKMPFVYVEVDEFVE